MAPHTEEVNGHTNGVNSPSQGAICTSAQQFLDHKYDFGRSHHPSVRLRNLSNLVLVIIGGGTAGLTIAARLTEDPDIHVGVLEAGPNRLGDPLVDTPAAFLQMLGNPDYDYMIRTPRKSVQVHAPHYPELE